MYLNVLTQLYQAVGSYRQALLSFSKDTPYDHCIMTFQGLDWISTMVYEPLYHRQTTLCLCGVITVSNLRLYIHATQSVEIFTEWRYLSFKEMLIESRVVPFRAVETFLWRVYNQCFVNVAFQIPNPARHEALIG